jgi:hypothetical protein
LSALFIILVGLKMIWYSANFYSCMSLYMRWPLKHFYTFNHMVDSYRNTISKWTVGFRYGNFTLKLAHGKKSLASRGLIFGCEEISIPETRPIRKSYISTRCLISCQTRTKKSWMLCSILFLCIMTLHHLVLAWVQLWNIA